MTDFITVEHPCVYHMKVPIWIRRPMTVAEFTNPNTPVSDYAAGLISYIFKD